MALSSQACFIVSSSFLCDQIDFPKATWREYRLAHPNYPTVLARTLSMDGAIGATTDIRGPWISAADLVRFNDSVSLECKVKLNFIESRGKGEPRVGERKLERLLKNQVGSVLTEKQLGPINEEPALYL